MLRSWEPPLPPEIDNANRRERERHPQPRKLTVQQQQHRQPPTHQLPRRGATLGDVLAVQGDGRHPQGQGPAPSHNAAAQPEACHTRPAPAPVVHLPPIPPRPSDVFMTQVDDEGSAGASPVPVREAAALRMKHRGMRQLLPELSSGTSENSGGAVWAALTGTCHPTPGSAAVRQGTHSACSAACDPSAPEVIDVRIAAKMAEVAEVLRASAGGLRSAAVAGAPRSPLPLMPQAATPQPAGRGSSCGGRRAARSESPPPRPRFVTALRGEERRHPTGSEVHQQRRAQRTAKAAAESRDHSVEETRLTREMARLERLRHDLSRFAALAGEQEAQSAHLAAAAADRRRTAPTIIAEWKAAAAGRVETEESVEQARYQRLQRRLAREEHDAQRRAEAIALSVKLRATGAAKPGTDPVAELEQERRRAAAPLVRRWRVVRGGGPVEVFAHPQLSAVAIAVLEGGEVLEELEAAHRAEISWVRTPLGWIATQLALGGSTKLQLTPEATTQHTNVRDFLYEQLDESTVAVERALEACPPERLKGAAEVRELLANAELHRQRVRELPSGHHQFIHQTWAAMQQRSRAQRRQQLERSRAESAAAGLDQADSEFDSDDNV